MALGSVGEVRHGHGTNLGQVQGEGAAGRQPPLDRAVGPEAGHIDQAVAVGRVAAGAHHDQAQDEGQVAGERGNIVEEGARKWLPHFL